MRVKHCLICGKEFIDKTKNGGRKYCNNCHELSIKRDIPDSQRAKGFPIREFYCKKCGIRVVVTDKHDKRSLFCSRSCEKAYWRHSHKHFQIAK